MKKFLSMMAFFVAAMVQMSAADSGNAGMATVCLQQKCETIVFNHWVYHDGLFIFTVKGTKYMYNSAYSVKIMPF